MQIEYPAQPQKTILNLNSLSPSTSMFSQNVKVEGICNSKSEFCPTSFRC